MGVTRYVVVAVSSVLERILTFLGHAWWHLLTGIGASRIITGIIRKSPVPLFSPRASLTLFQTSRLLLRILTGTKSLTPSGSYRMFEGRRQRKKLREDENQIGDVIFSAGTRLAFVSQSFNYANHVFLAPRPI